MENSLPLHLSRVQKSSLIINSFYFILHGTALLALIYYRAYSLMETTKNKDISISFKLCYILVFASELILSFLWLLDQSYQWRPVFRTVFPERLPKDDDKLPSIDVFICTADPNKEPSVEVMNTVVSAMALDYPPNKLHIYLSDDGGSSVTLKALQEAWRFGRFWVPFCRKYGIKTRCPEAYFSRKDDSDGNLGSLSSEFCADREKFEKQYEEFKERVQWIREKTSTFTSKNHPASIEIIKDVDHDDRTETNESEIPMVVYVSREKRPSHPHHFKAGALNVLLRVSSMLSNSPYILVLDCDMYCNDPSSARQAMCFHLDSSKLAFVQFPQKFHNISDKDIYDSQLRFIFTTRWWGVDGLKGPMVSGTGFYITREALYDTSDIQNDVDVSELRNKFGPSNEFVKSLHQKNIISVLSNEEFSNTLQKEIQFLASCKYENKTQWGKEASFRYFSVVEDYFTGMSLHSKGWTSVYCDPPKPAFLGSATTNFSELLVQQTRWCTGLVQVAMSKYSPLIYCPPRMSILQSMYYAEFAYFPFYCLPVWCLAIVPQLCLLHGIPLYPGISNPYFILFAFIFLSSNLKHIQEVLSVGHSIRTWIYEYRMWMIKSVTCYTYGTLDAIMEKIGMKEASFLPTNKVADEEQLKRYQSGIFDFQVSTMFLAPICTLVILNIACLLLGAVKIFRNANIDEMFIQACLSFFILIIQYPVVEGMILRKDKARVPQSATLLSALLAGILLSLGSLILIY
ncbi:hypothetical protein ACH5RR_031451 [Cinchona calisaya]|uniref:Cellulose synthase-like protein G2 n=1 Tax=Cinchona calisaya TaxID=153742 RepID=A0ABD2YFB0_9GENT